MSRHNYMYVHCGCSMAAAAMAEEEEDDTQTRITCSNTAAAAAAAIPPLMEGFGIRRSRYQKKGSNVRWCIYGKLKFWEIRTWQAYNSLCRCRRR